MKNGQSETPVNLPTLTVSSACARSGRAIDAAASPAQLVLVPGADHFFAGKLEQMQLALSGWIETHFVPAVTAK